MSEALATLLNRMSQSDYLDLFLWPCIIIALCIEIRFLRETKAILPLFLYTVATFLFYIISYIPVFRRQASTDFFFEGLNISFALIEYSLFYFYFKRVLSSIFTKVFMPYFIIPFTLTIAIYYYRGIFISDADIIVKKIPDFFISLELLLLAIPCFIYYYELLKMKRMTNLTANPSFWIVTGLLFYSITIIPFFIISRELQHSKETLYRAAYALHYILFGFLFLAITRAILCKKPLTT